MVCQRQVNNRWAESSPYEAAGLGAVIVGGLLQTGRQQMPAQSMAGPPGGMTHEQLLVG